MSDDAIYVAWIQSWDASYYEPTVKKWFYGQLKLATNKLVFVVNNAEELSCKPRIFCLDFADIKCISKAMSSMIFPALIAKTASNQIHWFASFQDRNSTFVVISHFFEASLLTTYSSSRSPNEVLASDFSSQKTELGTALLNSVHDSDLTLRKAASTLLQQKEQISSMSSTMQDIQEDLTVAERVTAGLNSWLGRWKMPKISKPGELIFLKENDIPDVFDVEVLYTKVLSSRAGCQTCGVCRVECNGITILDMKQKVIHHFKWSEVSRVRAVSPWEITLTQYLIGQPDLSFNIVSVHMPSVLSKVAKLAGRKLEYIEPSPNIIGPDRDPDSCHFSAQPPPYSGSSRGGNETSVVLTHQDIIPGHDQAQQQSCTSSSKFKEKDISDAEMAELTATLNNIKTTALEVKAEQESQLEDIDDLTSSVIRANDRIRKMNKTLGNLMK